jgi:hypothetical protein
VLDDYEFSRFLMLAVDAWRYGPRDDRQQVDLQRFLDEGLRTAARRSGLDDSSWQTQDAGDGRLALLPDSGSEPVLVDSFVRELDTWLARHNHDRMPGARLRLRIAVHNGPAIPAPLGYGGTAVVHVCRLRDSRPVRAALDAAPDANLVLAVSALIFDDVIRQRHTSLSVDDFTRVEIDDPVKDFGATAWVRVPGAPATRDEVVVGLRFPVPPRDLRAFVVQVLIPSFRAVDIALPEDTSFAGDDPVVRLPGVSPQAVLGVWVDKLDGLIKAGAPEVRVVVGVCATADHARELASSDIAARVLAGARGGRVVVVVPDHLHETITANPARMVHPEAYGQAGTSSWLRVPGHGKLPQPADRAPEQPVAAGPSSPVAVHTYGDNSVAYGNATIGTWVMGTYNHHDGANR